MDLTKQDLILFLKKGLFFLTLLISVIFCTLYLSNVKLKRQKQSYKFSSAIENLILGHSHSEFAYSDSIIKHTINLSQSGDSYFYIYLKAKILLKHNPQIKTVFIEYSNNQIDVKMNQWIWDNIHLNNKFTKLSAFVDMEDSQLLMRHNLRGYLANIGLATRKNIDLVLKPESRVYFKKDWGGFKPSYSSHIDSILRQNDRDTQSLHKPYLYPLSSSNIYYLQKTIRVLKEFKVKVILIRTPVHERYHYLNNEPKFDSIYKTDFDTIPFFDFKNYPLLNEQFEDDSHVNYKGAEELSRMFQDLIAQGLLESKTPQYLIDSLINRRIDERHFLYRSKYGYDYNSHKINE